MMCYINNYNNSNKIKKKSLLVNIYFLKQKNNPAK